jgi:hypothetical protein
MNCSLQPNGDLLFQEIDFFLATLLVQPLQQKERSSQIVNEYLFQKLTKQDPLFSQDWKEYIVPELQALFTSCHEKVLSDLASLEYENPSDKPRSFKIPLAHRDAWLRMLSIVRLSLAAEHHITEVDHQIRNLNSLSTAQEKGLFQIEIFSVLQQCLIEAESQGGPSPHISY